MSATAQLAIEDLGELPAPPPARPRVLLVATALACGAVVLFFASLLGVYLQERAATLAAGEEWGLPIPLLTGNMSLFGFVIASVCVQMAVAAIGNDDRRHTWLGLGATIFVAAMHTVGMAFLYSQVGLEVASLKGGLFFAVTGAHLALVLVAVLFVALMAFRTLGGQYSAKDREGVVAAALFWHTTALVYFGIWYAILVSK